MGRRLFDLFPKKYLNSGGLQQTGFWSRRNFFRLRSKSDSISSKCSYSNFDSDPTCLKFFDSNSRISEKTTPNLEHLQNRTDRIDKFISCDSILIQQCIQNNNNKNNSKEEEKECILLT